MINNLANKILWVEFWIQSAEQSSKDFQLSADQMTDGAWICEFQIPKVNKNICEVANSEIEVLEKASSKAYELIDCYLKETNADLINNPYENTPYEIVTDGNGHIKEIRIDSKFQSRKSEVSENQLKESCNLIEQAIQELKDINQVGKELYIQVFDKTIIGDVNSNSLDKFITNYLAENYDSYIYNLTWFETDESVVVFGYTLVE